MIHYALSKKAIDELLNEVRKSCKFTEEYPNVIKITSKRFSKRQQSALANLLSKTYCVDATCVDYITIYTCEGRDEMTDEEWLDQERNIFDIVEPYAEITLPTKESGFNSPIKAIEQISNYIQNNLVEHSDYELSTRYGDKTSFGTFESFDAIRIFCAENRIFDSMAVKTTLTYPTGVKKIATYDYEYRPR